MAKDLFQTTDEPQEGDTNLGNEFIDLDDPNKNGDFSQQESQIASDEFKEDKGGLDSPDLDHNDRGNDFDFSDESVMADEDLDADEFDDMEFIKDTPPSNSQNEEEESDDDDPNEGSESDDDNSFLDQVNKKYGKNFKTEAEFDAFMKGDIQEEQPQPILSDDEKKQYEKNKGNIEYINSILQMDDRKAWLQDAQISFARANNRKMTQEEFEEAEEKVDELDRQNLLSIYAENIRNKYSGQKANLQNYNDRLDDKVNAAKKAETKQNQQRLYENFKEIYVAGNKNFLGVELSTSDLQEAYNDVTSGDLVKRIMQNPQLAANLALIEKKLPEIKKAFSQPNNSRESTVLRSTSKKRGNRMGSSTRSSHRSVATQNAKKSDQEFLQ